MKIGIDISRYLDDSGGVGVYSANLLRYLLKIDKMNKYVAYTFFYDCFPANWKNAEKLNIFKSVSDNLKINRIKWPTWCVRKKWENASLEQKEKMLGDVNLIHSTSFTVPQFYSTKLIVTVHDLSFLIFPEYHTSENYNFVLRNLLYLNSRAKRVICDSNQTKKDLIKYFHIPENKIVVISGGVSYIFKKEINFFEREKIFRKYNLKEGYILIVSSIEPRKNLARVIKAFVEIIKIEKYRNLKLVCVGGGGWKNSHIYELVNKSNLKNNILFLGYVKDKELPLIYSGAKLFLYPSLYEGFGLPVLEAMASRVPVITSNVSSLPEVAGDAAVFVNPYSEREIYEAIITLLEQDELRGKLICKGLERVREFTWEKTARKTLGVYQEVLNL